MKKQVLSTIAAIALLAPAAYAEGVFEGTLTLGYSSGKIKALGGSQDIDVPSLRMDSTISLSDNFEFDLDLGARAVDPGLGPIELNVTEFSLSPRYTMANGLIVGAYYEAVDFNLKPIGIGTGGDSMGLTLGKDFGQWDIEAHLGVSDMDILGLIGGVDIMDFGLRGNYRVNDKFTLGGHFIYTDIDVPAPINGGSIFSVGLGAEYMVRDNLALFGGLGRQWLSETILGTPIGAHANRYSFGAAYTFGGNGQMMPMTASLELVRTDLALTNPVNGSANYDEIRIGLTIPLGHKGQSLPLNSAAYKASNGGRTALSHLLSLY